MTPHSSEARPASASASSDQNSLLAQVTELTAERQKLREELDRQRDLSEVRFTPHGLEAKNLSALWRLAVMYSQSGEMVPQHYQGKAPACMVAIQMASRCKVDPLAFMQQSYVVHGKPGVSGALVIAMLNASGKIKGRVRYAFAGQGDQRSCTACVTDKETDEEIKLTLEWKTVMAEGWHLPKGKDRMPSKWSTMPEQMFRYRAATWLVRAHYPEVLMGLHTADELEDDQDPEPATELQEGRNRLANGKHTPWPMPGEPLPQNPPSDRHGGQEPAEGEASRCAEPEAGPVSQEREAGDESEEEEEPKSKAKLRDW